jgi:hypothetical protein
MGKIKKEKELLYLTKDNNPISWKDIKDFQFEDDDVINIGWEEPYYSENNSYDGHFYVSISRMVEETDDEYNQRIAENIKFEEEMRRKRHEQYIKLKKEFEN